MISQDGGKITVWNESKYKFCNFVFELNVWMLLILIYNTNDTIIQYHKAQTRLGRLNFKTFIIVKQWVITKTQNYMYI